MNYSADARAPSAGPVTEMQLVATTQKLHDLLKQREFHLAELIDEVVYAEDRKEEALQGNLTVQQSIAQLELALQQLLRFHVVLSEDVILPTLLNALTLRADSRSSPASVLDGNSRRALQTLAVSPAMSRPTQQLIERVLVADAQASSGALDNAGTYSAAPQSDEGPASQTSNQKIEQAIVLSGMLWRKQRDLLANLDEVKTRLDLALVADDDYDGEVGRSHRTPSFGRRGSSADALVTINRRRSASSGAAQAASYAAIDLQTQLANLQRERDSLSQQLQTRGEAETMVASLLTDKRQLENELLYAQRRTLEEQNRNRDLKHQLLELEDALEKSQRASNQGLANTDEELRRISRSADIARSSLESEVARLRSENQALVESGERFLQNASTGDVAAKRKVAKLEGIIASLKTDLNIMESRLAVIQDQREVERQRILQQFEREKQRLKRERDECQQLIDKMAVELKLLSRDHDVMRGAASVDQL